MLHDIIESIRQNAGKAQFVSFTYKAKGTGEVARHTLILGASYAKQIEASITEMELLKPAMVGALQLQAWQEVYDSLLNSREAIKNGTYNPAYTKADAYIQIANGLKYCISTGCINVMGLAHTKVVIEKGEYKEVKSRPLTVEKNNLRDKLPINRVREFVLSGETLQSVRMDGDTMVIE
jgi:hypothetical protein